MTIALFRNNTPTLSLQQLVEFHYSAIVLHFLKLFSHHPIFHRTANFTLRWRSRQQHTQENKKEEPVPLECRSITQGVSICYSLGSFFTLFLLLHTRSQCGHPVSHSVMMIMMMMMTGLNRLGRLIPPHFISRWGIN